MEVNRRGNQITLVLDSEDEAVGLYAYLTGSIHEVPVDTAAKGAWLYGWFFEAIKKLATNYGKERAVATMTGETASPMPVAANPKKAKKR